MFSNLSVYFEKSTHIFSKIVVKIWGKASNLKRRGGGKESKFIEEYTPLHL
jgi:hypothetical protein